WNRLASTAALVFVHSARRRDFIAAWKRFLVGYDVGYAPAEREPHEHPSRSEATHSHVSERRADHPRPSSRRPSPLLPWPTQQPARRGGAAERAGQAFRVPTARWTLRVEQPSRPLPRIRSVRALLLRMALTPARPTAPTMRGSASRYAWD